MNLKNKKVAILGAAKSGQSVAELVLSRGGIPKISEQKPKDAIATELITWLEANNVQHEFGGHGEFFISDSDLLIISPGVRHDLAIIEWAKLQGIPVLGEIEFAYRFCPCPIIAITGSNGKTTVATLIYEILRQAGKNVRLCGNIGTPFSSQVLLLSDVDFVVLEVSSFQLETIIEFKPYIAVLLNFSQNHLDRHEDLQEYFDAKKRIFMNQTEGDHAVLNGEDPRIKELNQELNAQISYFIPFKATSDLSINPNHLAAMKVAEICEVDQDLAKKVCRTFKGVEHRLEWVRSLCGIDFINDSKSTTAEAGRWAVLTIDQPLVMICGGRDKNIDFSYLKTLIKNKVKKMFVIGEAKEKIKNTFQDEINIEECDALEVAVAQAHRQAQEGDCVLFSPMCASFDMFTNFEERGRVFKEIVNNLDKD